jgi:hypothetical protein
MYGRLGLMPTMTANLMTKQNTKSNSMKIVIDYRRLVARKWLSRKDSSAVESNCGSKAIYLSRMG